MGLGAKPARLCTVPIADGPSHGLSLFVSRESAPCPNLEVGSSDFQQKCSPPAAPNGPEPPMMFEREGDVLTSHSGTTGVASKCGQTGTLAKACVSFH